MPRYSKDFIIEIKSRLKVSDVVGKFVKLTQRGNEYVGLSPFKNEKTPSFTVNDDKEFYHCFSSSEHGDIFSFLMKHKSMSYPEAIEHLAKQAGLNPDQGIIKDSNKNNYQMYEDLRKVLNEANRFFQNNLKNSSLAKKYLETRGIKNEFIQKFEIGYVGNSNNDLSTHLLNNGFKIKDAVALGLIKKSNFKENEFYDFFRNRLIFPIKDYKSNVIAFGGRTLEQSEIKYINSSDSHIFKKSFNLFNLNLAIEDSRQPDDLLVVEGYMDAISLYQNNFKSVVAPLGTALTKFQIEQVWKYCRSPIIIFDGDEAGQNAAMRAARLTLSLLKPDFSMRFCILPQDYDPDDFLNKKGKAEFKKLILKSFSLSDFIWMNEYSREDISTPEKKAGFERRIKKIILEIQDTTVRAYYNKDFSERLFNLRKTFFKKGNDNWANISTKVSKETVMSDRVNLNYSESVVREKIIILTIIENPFVISKYAEDLGKLNFNNLELLEVCSKIVEYISINDDKDLENLDVKSYLIEKGLKQQLKNIYKPSLLSTYRSFIENDEKEIEKGFLELLNLQKKFLGTNELDQAVIDLEENMDEKSFENFVKLKKESFNKN